MKRNNFGFRISDFEFPPTLPEKWGGSGANIKFKIQNLKSLPGGWAAIQNSKIKNQNCASGGPT